METTDEFFPVSRPSLSNVEERYLLDAFRSGWISSIGPYLRQFEERFAARCGVDFAVATTSGTTALHLALAAAGIGKDDEVIVPDLTYVATPNAVAYCGARAVCVDVLPTTWCLDPAAVEAAIGPRTRAIIAVDAYGHPADYESLRAIARRHGLFLLGDAAESFGASVGERPTGSLADATVFSFFGNKIITSGEGGCVTTADPALADRMRLLRGQGMDPQRRYWFPVLGYNYRMTNLCAALLCAQLDRADDIIAARDRVVAGYEEHLAGAPMVTAQPTGPDVRRGPWMASFLIGEQGATDLRDRLARRLSQVGVDTRPFFVPIHELPAHRQTGDFAVTTDLSRRGINLPTYVDMDEPAVKTVVHRIRQCLDAELGLPGEPGGSAL